MSKPTKAQQLELEAEIAALNSARDWGRDYYRMFPDLMLIAVAREGAERFEAKPHQMAFVQGYTEARANHEAFKRGE